jgi:transcriptional regulator with XRE-family HTH domain
VLAEICNLQGDMNVKSQPINATSERTVGEAIRERRENQRMSVRTLASKAGFSPSFISQLENSQASPSINSLERIADCLGLTLGAFFNALEPREAAVTRASERRQLTSGWSKAKIESLGHGAAALAMEPVLVTLAIGGSSGKAAAPPAHEEFVFVLDGEVTLTLAANDFVLRTGDAASIPTGQLRKFRNRGVCPARIIIVSARGAV